jgi:hypothetical protein
MAVCGRTGIFTHRIDQTTDCNASVQYEHREVHAGDAFYYTYTAEADAAATIDRFIITPNTTRWAHLVWEVEAQYKITIEIIEAITGAHQALTVENRNRNYAGGNTTAVHEPTEAPAGGTVIYKWISGNTTTRGGSVAINRASGELVLKQNTHYLFRITSAVNDNNITEYLTWYEHTNIEN